MSKLIPTIGLEMHCEMKSTSKVFSASANTYSRHSNTHVAPVDQGLPGILPVVNKECVRKSILMASILQCEIPEYLLFDRKNYYYPDLPKGYQITQSHSPIGVNGMITVPFGNSTLDVKIHDIHLEEDTARLEHLADETLINYNRSGVPLLELVTEPVFHSKEEVLAFLEYIRKIYQYTDISDADVRKGQIRCDVNISVGEENGPFGTRVEVKNVNSFSNVEKVIDAEVARQMKLIEENRSHEIEQETRRYDEETNSTIRMRSKEDALDYKYFVEPNIPKIRLSKEWIKEIQDNIVELPLSRMNRYRDLNLTEEDINTLVREKAISDYYDQCLELGCDSTLACNWITSNILAYVNKENISFTELEFSPKELHLLLSKIKDGTISSKQAKEVADKVLKEKKKVSDVLSNMDSQISDEGYLEELITKIVNDNPSQVEAYKNGRTNLFNFFVGAVMKETKGQANPVLTKEIITKKLSE